VKKVEFFDLLYLKRNEIPNIDYHSHTYFTDAIGTPLEYASVAEEKGLSSLLSRNIYGDQVDG
jgi:hypothetical protein